MEIPLRKILFPALAAVSLAMLPSAVLAHVKLVASTPAANSSVATPGRIVLTFNERLIAATTRTEVIMTGMPGMNDHPLMNISGYTSQMSPDGKALTLLLRRSLARGSYVVKWSSAGADTHRMGGEFSFTVR